MNTWHWEIIEGDHSYRDFSLRDSGERTDLTSYEIRISQQWKNGSKLPLQRFLQVDKAAGVIGLDIPAKEMAKVYPRRQDKRVRKTKIGSYALDIERNGQRILVAMGDIVLTRKGKK